MKRTSRAAVAALSLVGAVAGAGAALSGTAWLSSSAQGDPQVRAVQSSAPTVHTLHALRGEAARLRGLLNNAASSVSAPALVPEIVTPQPQPTPQPTHASTGASGATGGANSEQESESEGQDD
jgi:hypothetical protein